MASPANWAHDFRRPVHKCFGPNLHFCIFCPPKWPFLMVTLATFSRPQSYLYFSIRDRDWFWKDLERSAWESQDLFHLHRLHRRKADGHRNAEAAGVHPRSFRRDLRRPQIATREVVGRTLRLLIQSQKHPKATQDITRQQDNWLNGKCSV